MPTIGSQPSILCTYPPTVPTMILERCAWESCRFDTRLMHQRPRIWLATNLKPANAASMGTLGAILPLHCLRTCLRTVLLDLGDAKYIFGMVEIVYIPSPSTWHKFLQSFQRRNTRKQVTCAQAWNNTHTADVGGGSILLALLQLQGLACSTLGTPPTVPSLCSS